VRAAEFVDEDDAAMPVTQGTYVAGGNGGGAVHPATDGAPAATAVMTTDIQTAAVQAVLADKMGDAPLCDTCGHITVRNGSCYRCLNCGDSKGCS
jgi:ribonucleoside-diphosphate reductase alpha chain